MFTKNCLKCNKSFECRWSKRKYCCSKCSGGSIKKRKTVPRIEIECGICNTKFKTTEYIFNLNKSGLKFCSLKCKNLAQRADSEFTTMRPNNWGKGPGYYITKGQRNCIEKYGKLLCERCKYDKYPIFHVHHIDRDRANSQDDNLIVLCPNCHEEDHYLNKDGRWASEIKNLQLI
jgi:hypothetical protein